MHAARGGGSGRRRGSVPGLAPPTRLGCSLPQELLGFPLAGVLDELSGRRRGRDLIVKSASWSWPSLRESLVRSFGCSWTVLPRVGSRGLGQWLKRFPRRPRVAGRIFLELVAARPGDGETVGMGRHGRGDIFRQAVVQPVG